MFHREGYTSIAVVFLVVAGLVVVDYFFVPHCWYWLHAIIFALCLFLIVAILQFFRNPKRNWITDDNAIICPADGKVVVIEEVFEPEYLKEERIQISVFMSPTNVHVNRYPISGVVDYVKYHAGKYLVAWHPKSSTENERTTVVVSNSRTSILMRQIAGAVARRIVYYSKVGDTAKQSGEMGFIKFGSRVDVFVPKSATIKVSLEEKVKGGITVLATIDG